MGCAMCVRWPSLRRLLSAPPDVRHTRSCCLSADTHGAGNTNAHSVLRKMNPQFAGERAGCHAAVARYVCGRPALTFRGGPLTPLRRRAVSRENSQQTYHLAHAP